MKVKKPTLLLDEEKCKSNIKMMLDKAIRSNASLAPHFKTHQSLHIGQWFKDLGVDEITVSSVTMARYFAEDGWEKIFIAIPVNIHELDEIRALAKISDISILVADNETLQYLIKEKISVQVNLEIDCGYHRSGIIWSDSSKIKELGSTIQESEKLTLRGLYCHDGNTYSSSPDEIRRIHKDTISKLKGLRGLFKEQDIELSMGDTPSCSITEDFEGIDIVRPGNFVFYDLMQASIGSCNVNQIAVAMVCPVISIYRERGEAIIYGGGVHFSKDRMNYQGYDIYGLVVELNEDYSWGEPIPDCVLRSISQEHGIVKLGEEYLDTIKVGSNLAILPIHSCMTADKMGFYLKTRNLNKVDHLSGNQAYYHNSVI